MSIHKQICIIVSAAIVAIFLTPSVTLAQSTKSCIIAAANANAYSYNTEIITGCKINTRTGKANYKVNGNSRQREYLGKAKMTQKYFGAARYWLKRSSKFKVNPNPANMDIKHFLEEATRAEESMAFVRDRRGEKALTIVYITDGIFRSIDFKGTNVRDIPFGFLTTE